jgi:hydrogenase-4 membrane subunit HyfE
VSFLVLYCLLLLLSVFSPSWRLSLLALGLQAIGMGAYLIASRHAVDARHAIALLELFVVKGVAVPWFLFGRFAKGKVPRFIDLIPVNLLYWTIAAFFIAAAYLAASELAAGDDREVMLVGAAFSAIALGMLALSSQNGVPGQIIAVLTVENGVTLFAIGASHETPFGLELIVVLDFIGLVVLAGNLLRHIGVRPVAETPSDAPLAQPLRAAPPDFGDVL